MRSITTSRRRRTRRSRGGALLVVLMAGVLSMTACTDDDPEPPEPGPVPQSAALELTLADGASELTPANRDQLQTDVGDVLTAYVVSAFLGDYPRDDFVDVLDSFTSGAARKAARDLDLLTGSRFSTAQDVVASSLAARISTFAPDQDPQGATAAVNFEFDVVAEDGSTSHVQLSGRLMLAPDNGAWKIFGYDVSLEDAAGGGT